MPRVIRKRACVALIVFFMLTVGITPISAGGNESAPQTFTGDRYHEITAYEADALFASGKSFILIYYSHECGLTLSRATLFQQLMDDYGVYIYGLDGIYERGPSWMWSKFRSDNGQAKQISYPVVCTVINNSDYTCLDGSYSLSEQLLQISDYLQKTENKQLNDAIWQGFYKLNSAMHNKERTDREALNNYLVSTEYIQSDDPAIVSLSREIVNGCSGGYEKLKAIHDWVSENIVYDLDTFRYSNDDYYSIQDKDYSAKGTLESKLSVCAGYANLTAALARSAGIPCKVVTGFADGRATANLFHDLFSLYKNYLNTGDEAIFSQISSNHAWNEAFVDGRWVVLDTTWDSNNEYLDGKTTRLKSDDRYFDMDLKEFSETHAFWKSEFFDYNAADIIKGPETNSVTAVPTSSAVMVAGEIIPVDAYNINDNNYFKLRDLAYILKLSNSEKQFEARWDDETKTVNIITWGNYTPVGGELETGKNAGSQIAVVNSFPIYLDGELIELTAYTINGNNYFKLRDIASVINFDVYWEEASSTIIIDPYSDYTPD